jgi:hypothetical protein
MNGLLEKYEGENAQQGADISHLMKVNIFKTTI